MKKQKAKSLNRFIQYLADQLPDQWDQGSTQVSITGEDLLLSGMATSQINGKPIQKEQEYLMEIPVLTKANHAERILDAFKLYGIAGVHCYLKPYIQPGAELTFARELDRMMGRILLLVP